MYTLSADCPRSVIYANPMAREDCSERGLPSAEVRRQILQHAGTILDEARDLVAWLDKQECSTPWTGGEHHLRMERESSLISSDAHNNITQAVQGHALVE